MALAWAAMFVARCRSSRASSRFFSLGKGAAFCASREGFQRGLEIPLRGVVRLRLRVKIPSRQPQQYQPEAPADDKTEVPFYPGHTTFSAVASV